jgi:indole-3-acetate monooxygenase
VGRAETMLTSARAYIFEVVGDLWTTLVSGGEPTPAQIAHVMIAPIHVIGVPAYALPSADFHRSMRAAQA